MSIKIENLSFTYMQKTPYEKKALDNISFEIDSGEIFGIIGSTGSGKSTFIQHLNGLLPLQEGNITVDDISLNVKKPDFKALRLKVGMVFQYPEYQLFENTVRRDVEFGAKNLGIKGEELSSRVLDSLALVGMDETYLERSPFELSGGQKRRVAIAGILVMRPEILILDEPSAGLDPKGKQEIIDLVRKLKKDYVKTVIIISHDMNEIAETADRIAVFYDGKVIYVERPSALFTKSAELSEIGLDIPDTVKIANALRDNGMPITANILRKKELTEEIRKILS